MGFANILSQFVMYLPVLLTLSFAELMFFFILMKSILSIISFMDSGFGVMFKE